MHELVTLIAHSTPLKVVLSMIVFTVIGTILFTLIARKLQKKKRSDVDLLFDCARIFDCSEYDIFHKSGEKWGFSDDRIEEDFRDYLLQNELPYYVKEFVRKEWTDLYDRDD